MRDMKRIGEIIQYTSRLAYAGEWETLDEYVRSFDYAHEEPVFTIAVLRSTYAMRTKLRYWKDAVQRASLHCSPRELQGLLD